VTARRFSRMRVSRIALAIFGLASIARAQPAAPVVLISIDGLRPDYVLAADAHGLKIPGLRRIVREGAHATGVVGVLPTMTYPSHTTLITGVAPARHGVYSNNTFDPLSKNQDGWFWYAEDIKARTLWDAAAEAKLVTGNVHWPVSVGAPITHSLPQIWRTGMADDRKLVRALSTPGLMDSLERTLGPYADGIDESIEGDELRAKFAVRLLETKRPRFTTLYFTGLDHEQHASGPFSPAALATLERTDAIIDAVTRAARRASNGRAIVCIVSDHGFIKTNRSVNLIAEFRRAGLVTYGADERRSDWRAVPWGAGASAAIMLRDSTDAATRETVRALITRLAADTASGIDRVLDPAELRRRGGFPTAAWYVALKPGFTLGGNSTASLIAQVNPGGTHGYLADQPEMRASFFIAGPGIIAGRSLGEIDMRDIAPTLASLLGLSLPRAEGRTFVARLR
jgi:predicted AlkP superfamily pyrophosphatase or phosphodiesterase